MDERQTPPGRRVASCQHKRIKRGLFQQFSGHVNAVIGVGFGDFI
jgi:hypothetical protein